MPDDDAFLRAIGAAPADDAPRLVYADWLDEHGQPERAEFIRVQCELARPGGERMRRTELRLRERELLAEHGEDWTRPFRKCRARKFERGFVVALTGQAQHFERLDPSLLAAGIVQEVQITGPSRSTHALDRLAHLTGIRTWRFSSLGLRERDLLDLAEFEPLASVELLDLRWNDLTGPATLDLCQHGRLPSSKLLMLGGNHIGPEPQQEITNLLGSRVTFEVDHPPGALYELSTKPGWLTGLDATGKQVIVMYTGSQTRRLTAFYFDLDGALLSAEVEPGAYPGPLLGSLIADDRRVRRFLARIGLIPGPISVQKFHHDATGVCIRDFSFEDRWHVIWHPPESPELISGDRQSERFHHLKYVAVPNGHFEFPGIDV
jgi:uncharacterized protein (TIGR02996 family)